MRPYHFFCATAAFFLLFSCEKKEQEVPVSSVSITQATAEMIIGETIQLTATVLPSNATEKNISWASSKISVATVAGGKVAAIAEGTSTITASCGGKSATCQVTVSKAYVAVTSVTLNKTELTLEKGKTETLTATVSPSDATDQTVTWSSSKTDIAIVDANGKVTAVAGGSAIITAKAGDKQATCAVTVTVPVESVSLDKESVSLEEGESATLVATVKPDDATDKTVTWSTSDAQIATVDETGKVLAIKEGETTITAKAGEKSITCSIIVAMRSPDAVDLGLSVKWASCNLGARNPEEYGNYYAWGETEPKSDYSWETYKWCDGSSNTLTKYNWSSSYGTVDKKGVLDAEDDAAHVKLGGNWRMPSSGEAVELLTTWNKSDYRWEWKTINSHKGWLVTYLVNNNSIFLPAAGFRTGTLHLSKDSYGDYWTSYMYTSLYKEIWYFSFGADGVYQSSGNRYWGLPIRPVTE